MKRVNFKSDFKLRLQPMSGGVAVGVPEDDFVVQLHSNDGGRVWRGGRKAGVLQGVEIEGDTVVCLLHNHCLAPGRLRCEWITYSAEPRSRDEGVESREAMWRTVTPQSLDVELVVGAGDGASTVEAAVTEDITAVIDLMRASASAAEAAAARANAAAAAAELAKYINDGDYNSERKALELKHDDEVVVAIDARPFIKDGMVADVKVADGQLVIMFNTDAGRQDISLALTDIFNPENYYTKGDSDLRFALKSDLVDAYTKGESDARFAALNGSEGQDFAVKDLKIGDNDDYKWTMQAGTPTLRFKTPTNNTEIIVAPKSGVLALTSDIPDVSGKVNVGDVATINEQSLVSGGNLELATATEVSALKTALANFCPIIEDTRTAAVATITGVAPFSELVDGQRIVIRIKQMAQSGNGSVQLTLSDGTKTAEIPLYYNMVTGLARWTFGTNVNQIRVGAFIELVYDEGNGRWVILGYKDTNDINSGSNQSDIDNGTTYNKLISAKLLVDNFARRVNEVSVADAGDVEQALAANTFYKFGVCDSLTLTLASASAGLAIYAGKFTAGASGCTLVLPDDVQLGANVADIEGGKTYEFSIMDNVLLMVEV